MLPILKSTSLKVISREVLHVLSILLRFLPHDDEPKGLLLPNPEHDIWLTADRLLVGWFYNSMTPQVATQVMGHDEAKALSESIQEYFGMQSRSQKDHNR